MAHYIAIDSTVFEEFLQGLGFHRTVSNNEVVYERAHEREPALKIKCYTSSRIGAESARDVGKDAIRVVAIFQKEGSDKSYPIFRGARVYRTTSQESVQERTAERIKNALSRCDEWLGEQEAKRNPNKGSVPLPHSNDRQSWPTQEQALAEMQANKEDAANEYFGKLGDNVRLTLTVVARKEWGSPPKYLFTMKDDAERTFVYWSLKDLLKPGETYNLGATITGYNTFRNVRQTTLSDVAGKRVVL